MPRLDEWRFSFDVAWDDMWYRWQSIATLALFCLVTSFVLWKIIPVGLENHLVVFHYNQYLGIDEVQPWGWVFAQIAGALVVMLISLVGSFRTFRHDKIASRLLLCAATISMIFFSAAAIAIVSINA
ncbi:MAG: hypothetical protein KIH65_003060 [Candidatus Uhrbacteria bacterium]|nr:hypothetical protein [Candidatus Uhrbacteria bacterium]